MQFASITSQSGLLVWVVGLITGCLLINAIGAFRSVNKVRLRVHSRMFVEEGSVPREPWQVINDGKRRAKLITVESNNRVWFTVAQVAAGKTVAAPPRDVFKKRGVYSLDGAWLVSLYPFGLVKAMRDTECDAEVLVFPKLYDAEVPEVRGLDPMLGGRHAGPGRVASGEKFAGVRPLQSGDSYKQIHWKSSAKGTGLMVKSFEEELAGRAALLVYCEKGGAHSEACIRAAGSIALAGIEAGHEIDFQNLNQGRRVRIKPFGETSRLLEELARYETPPTNLSTAQMNAIANEMPKPKIARFIPLSELNRRHSAKVALSEETIRNAIMQVPKRSAIHFVVTGINAVLEGEIHRLLNARKLVVVHLPAGVSADIGCAIHNYPVE